MTVAIALLLAVSGALFVGSAFRLHRVLGAFAGSAWLLIAVYCAGLNIAGGLNQAFARPFASLAAFGTAALVFFLIGPGSGLWRWAAGLSPARTAKAAVQRWGVSPRVAMEAAAMAAAVVLLLPASHFTRAPDPAYDYALAKFEGEIVRRLPDIGQQTAGRAVSEALHDFKAGPVRIDDDALRAAEEDIRTLAVAMRSRMQKDQRVPEATRQAQNNVAEIEQGGRAERRAEIERAAREAASQTAEAVLKAELKAVIDAARVAMEAARNETAARERAKA